MKLVYPTVLCVLAYMIGALSHVRAQFSVEQLQNLATNALNILLDSASSGSSASSRQCIPYKVGICLLSLTGWQEWSVLIL